MIALLIFMVIALGLAQGELAALRAHTDNVLRDTAIRLAEDQLDDLRGTASSLEDDRTWTDAPGLQALDVPVRGGVVRFTRAFQITDTGATAVKLRRIAVVVGWDQGNLPQLEPTKRNHQVVLNTIVQL